MKLKELKTKIIDWFDNLYFKITDLRVRRFWENIGRWFSYYNVLRKTYDFDYSSILEVEYHQIKRVRDCIKYYHNHLYANRDIQKMNLALRLLEIIAEDGCSEYVGKSIEFKECEEKPGLYTIIDDPNSYYTLPVYVNTRNSNRFCSYKDEYYTNPQTGNMWKDHLRVEKAWKLYYKLREQWTRSWWD